MFLAQAEFLLRAGHAFGHDSANLARFKRLVFQFVGIRVDQASPGERKRDLLPLSDVRGAGDNGELMLTGFNVGEHEPVSIGMLRHAAHQAYKHVVPAVADMLDLLCLKTGHGHALGEHVR